MCMLTACSADRIHKLLGQGAATLCRPYMYLLSEFAQELRFTAEAKALHRLKDGLGWFLLSRARTCTPAYRLHLYCCCPSGVLDRVEHWLHVYASWAGMASTDYHLRRLIQESTKASEQQRKPQTMLQQGVSS